MDTSKSQNKTPTKYAVALFNGFQALDVFGPIDILNFVSRAHPLELYMLSNTSDPVSTLHKASPGFTGQQIVPTHTFADAPEDIEVLLVPGGMGTRDLQNTQPVVDFIKSRFPSLRYLLTVCTGSAVAAQTGVLDGKRATSNKKSFSWVKAQGPSVDWVREARWVQDENIWTSSGVTAGIDMMFAFFEAHYGAEFMETIAIRAEYVRNMDSEFDPFAKYPENV